MSQTTTGQRRPSPRSPRRRWPLLAGITVAAIAAAAIAYTALTPSAPATGPAGNSSTATAAVTAFTAHTSTGAPVTVPGGKPSAMLFLSASCGTCGPAAHALAAVQAADPPGANYVVVDIDPSETPADIAAFLATNQATTLASTSDTTGALTRAFGVTQLSTAVFLGPDGQVTARAVEPTATQIRDQLHTGGTR